MMEHTKSRKIEGVNAGPKNYDFMSEPDSLANRQWIEGLRNGDDECYADLVRAQSGRLLKVARRYLSEADAREAVQETFVKAYESIEQFQATSSISTWLHRIVVNCCLTQLRRSKSKKEVSIDTLLPSFLEDGHRHNPSPAWPDECLEITENREFIMASINKLPENHRTVLLLRDIEEFTGEETAKALGISIAHVKVRLHRSRKAFRELIDAEIHHYDNKD